MSKCTVIEKKDQKVSTTQLKDGIQEYKFSEFENLKESDICSEEMSTCVEVKVQMGKIQEKTKLGRITRKPSRYRHDEYDISTKFETTAAKENLKKKSRTYKSIENVHKQTAEVKQQENSNYSDNQVVPVYCNESAGKCVTFDSEGNFKFKVCSEHIIQNKSTKVTTYKCDICCMLFPRSFSLSRHYERIHINPLFVKNKSKKIINQGIERQETKNQSVECKDQNNKEEESHYLYACKLCRQRVYFKKKNQLRNHCQEKHSDLESVGRNVFQCDTCDRKCSTKHELDRHGRSHSGEKPYPCRICGKRFPTSTNVRRHERIHTGERPFVCKVCKKSFFQKSEMVKHLLSVHKMKVTKTKAEKAKKVIPSKCFSHDEEKAKIEEVNQNNKFEENIDFAAYLKLDQFEPSSLMGYANNEKNTTFCRVKSKPKHNATSTTLNKTCKSTNKKNNVEQEKLFKCSDCPKSFTSSINMKRHYRLKHDRQRSLRAAAPVSMVVQKYMIKDENSATSLCDKPPFVSENGNGAENTDVLSQNNRKSPENAQLTKEQSAIEVAVQNKPDEVILIEDNAVVEDINTRKSLDELLKVVSNSTEKWIPDKKSISFPKIDSFEKPNDPDNNNNVRLNAITNSPSSIFKPPTNNGKIARSSLVRSYNAVNSTCKDNNNSSVFTSEDIYTSNSKSSLKQSGKLNRILERLSYKKESDELPSVLPSQSSLSISNKDISTQQNFNGQDLCHNIVTAQDIKLMKIPPFKRKIENTGKKSGTVLHKCVPSEQHSSKHLSDRNNLRSSIHGNSTLSSTPFYKRTFPYNSMNHNLQTSSKNKADHFQKLNAGSSVKYPRKQIKDIGNYSQSFQKLTSEAPSYAGGIFENNRREFSPEQKMRSHFNKPHLSKYSFLDRCWNSKMNAVNSIHPCNQYQQYASHQKNLKRKKHQTLHSVKNSQQSNKRTFQSSSYLTNKSRHNFNSRHSQLEMSKHEQLNYRPHVHNINNKSTMFNDLIHMPKSSEIKNDDMPLNLSKKNESKQDYVMTEDGILDFSKKKIVEKLPDNILVPNTKSEQHKLNVPAAMLNKSLAQYRTKPFRCHDMKFDNASNLKFHNVEFNKGKQVLGQCLGGRPAKTSTYQDISYPNKYANKVNPAVTLPWNSKMKVDYVRQKYSPYSNPRQLRPRSISGDEFYQMRPGNHDFILRNRPEFSQKHYQQFHSSPDNKYCSTYQRSAPPKYRLPNNVIFPKGYYTQSQNVSRHSSNTTDFYHHNKSPIMLSDHFSQINHSSTNVNDPPIFNHNPKKDFSQSFLPKPPSDVIKSNMGIIKKNEKISQVIKNTIPTSRKNFDGRDVMQRCIEKARSELQQGKEPRFSKREEEAMSSQSSSFCSPLFDSILSGSQVKTISNNDEIPSSNVECQRNKLTMTPGYETNGEESSKEEDISCRENQDDLNTSPMQKISFFKDTDESSLNGKMSPPPLLYLEDHLFLIDSPSSQDSPPKERDLCETQFKSNNETECPLLFQDQNFVTGEIVKELNTSEIVKKPNTVEEANTHKITEKQNTNEINKESVISEMIEEPNTNETTVKLEPNTNELVGEQNTNEITKELKMSKIIEEPRNNKIMDELNTISPKEEQSTDKSHCCSKLSTNDSIISSKTEILPTDHHCSLISKSSFESSTNANVIPNENVGLKGISNIDYPALLTTLKETNLSTEYEVLKETDLCFEKNSSVNSKESPGKKNMDTEDLNKTDPDNNIGENENLSMDTKIKLVKKIKLVAVKSKGKGIAEKEWAVKEISKSNGMKDAYNCKHCLATIKGKSVHKKHESRCSLTRRYSLRKKTLEDTKKSSMVLKHKKKSFMLNSKSCKSTRSFKTTHSGFTWKLQLSHAKKAVSVVELAEALLDKINVIAKTENVRSNTAIKRNNTKYESNKITVFVQETSDVDLDTSIPEMLKTKPRSFCENSLNFFACGRYITNEEYDLFKNIYKFNENFGRRTEVIGKCGDNVTKPCVGPLSEITSTKKSRKLDLDEIDTYFQEPNSHDHTYDFTELTLKRQLARFKLLENFESREVQKCSRVGRKLSMPETFEANNQLIKSGSMKSLKAQQKVNIANDTKEAKNEMKKNTSPKKRRSIRVYSKKYNAKEQKNEDNVTSDSEN